MKKFILSILLYLTCSLAQAQFISPTELGKIFALWSLNSQQDLYAYIQSLDSGWKYDPSGFKAEQNDVAARWLYISEPYQVAVIDLTDVRQSGTNINKVSYTTSNKTFFYRYVTRFQESTFKVVYAGTQSDGSHRMVYQNGDIFFILTEDPPTSSGLIVYSITVQGS